ncbi:MAG: polyprenyl synthetase family protein [Candidatus Avilachnospira sp.]|jgi:geranylgeranyl diphosphate synthase type II
MSVRQDFTSQLELRVKYTDKAIGRYLPEEKGRQKTVFEACNYSILNGGKRIRPILMQSAYILCLGEDTSGKSFEDIISLEGYNEDLLLPFMAAIEMIHSSSLVHDDLPCMDNDRLRRGKPSTWAKFGEDMGVLAGDGLMIYAFETACKAKEGIRGKESKLLSGILDSLFILAQKTGIYGMIGGQTVDVELTGKKTDEDSLDFIYRLKTGALLEASFMIGASLAGASSETVAILERAAGRLGMAFQIQDDILDEISSEEVLGKPVHSDERNLKHTYVSFKGMEGSKKAVAELTEEAKELIRSVGNYDFLTELCDFLISRKS